MKTKKTDTTMTNDEIIEVVTARKNGEKIERQWKGGLPWFPMQDTEEFNFEMYDYRVASSKLPKTWKEFSKISDIPSETYLDRLMPFIGWFKPTETRSYYTKAFVALAKIIMLRDYYNGYETPSKEDRLYYLGVSIGKSNGRKFVTVYDTNSAGFLQKCRLLQFHTPQLRDEFMKNFEGLILEAAELLY